MAVSSRFPDITSMNRADLEAEYKKLSNNYDQVAQEEQRNSEEAAQIMSSQEQEIAGLREQISNLRTELGAVRSAGSNLADDLLGKRKQITAQAEIILELKKKQAALSQALRDAEDTSTGYYESQLELQSQLLKLQQAHDLQTAGFDNCRGNVRGLTHQVEAQANELKRKDYAAQDLQVTISQQKEMLDKFVAVEKHLVAERDYYRQEAEKAQKAATSRNTSHSTDKATIAALRQRGATLAAKLEQAVRGKRVLLAGIELHRQYIRRIDMLPVDKELYKVLDQVAADQGQGQPEESGGSHAE